MTPADFRTLIERQLMPYDYARERHDARNADMGDDDEVTAFDLRDEDDAPRERSPFRCVRGDCGALDCSRCHPEGEGGSTCANCMEEIAEGEEHQCS